MENKSQNNGNRRQSGNRSGGRNRNRRPGNQQGNSNRSRNGNRNRSRNRSRKPKAPPKPTIGQKILSILTFGLLGKPKANSSSKPKQKAKPASKPAPKASTQPKPKPKKARQKTEVTSGRLYVGNLDYAATEHDLEELFRGIGNVLAAEVVTNSRTQQSKGFAFVEMVSVDEAKRAVEVLDDQEFMGRKLIVSGARSDGPREAEEDLPTEQPTEAEAKAEDPEPDAIEEAEETEEASLTETRA